MRPRTMSFCYILPMGYHTTLLDETPRKLGL